MARVARPARGHRLRRHARAESSTIPSQAKPVRESIVALRALATLGSHPCGGDLGPVAGRPGGTLIARRAGDARRVATAASLTKTSSARSPGSRSNSASRCSTRCTGWPPATRGFSVETKPASIAFHYRNVADAVGRRCRRRTAGRGGHLGRCSASRRARRCWNWPSSTPRRGTRSTPCGTAWGPSAVVYFGDDVTDEDAFVAAARPRRGGQGGGWRDRRPPIGSPIPPRWPAGWPGWPALREAWLAGADAVPIERHAHALRRPGDGAGGPAGARLVWMCAPRMDGPALFACARWGAIQRATSRSSRSARRQPPPAAYDGNSLILKTVWPRLTVTDFLDCSAGKPTQRAGRTDLVRQVEGRGEVLITFAPRLDFGRSPHAARDPRRWPRDRRHDRPDRAAGAGRALGDPRRGAPPDGRRHDHAQGRAAADGAAVWHRLAPGAARRSVPQERYRLTKAYWESWADRLVLPKREGRWSGEARWCSRGSATAHRRHCGGSHHQPAGADRRDPQLGLPLLLAAGCGDVGRGAGQARHRSPRRWAFSTGCSA